MSLAILYFAALMYGTAFLLFFSLFLLIYRDLLIAVP